MKNYTYNELVKIAERGGANCATTAIGRMMDMIEEETGSWPSWGDIAPEWVVRNVLGTPSRYDEPAAAAPEIKTTRKFDSSRIREECIKNDWYTWGDCEEYENLLSFARRAKYSATNLYKIARDIYEHSDKEHLPEGKEGVECIMFVVERFATFTTFEIV